MGSINDLPNDDQAWEEALTQDLTEQLETVAQYEGHLLDSAIAF